MRMNRIKPFLMVLVLTVTMAFMAVDAQAAYSVKQIWARFQGTAGETLVVGDAVCIKDADGLVYKADANDAALRPAVGVAGIKAASGAKVEVIVHGVLRGWTTLSEGAAAYLSETAGAITQSAPAWSQQLGFAISTTEYLINARAYLDTSALTALGVLTGASPLILEGATADAYETTIAVTDPTADRTVTIPDASGAVMLSTGGVVGTENAVSGVSNGFEFEGATADAYETTLTVTDPTADRTVTLPDATGTVAITGTHGGTSHNYAGGNADWTLTALEAEATYIATTNAATGGANAILSSCRAGKQYYVDNSSGQTVTLKVTGQTGATVATGKMALYVCTGTDVKQLYTQP